MSEPLRLLCVFAHPDDESLGAGATLARYAAEGVATYVLTATRGERGWYGAPDDHPGLAELGRRREAELRAAAAELGVHEVSLLDYIDGDLDQASAPEAVAAIVAHVRRIRPQVVITFGPDGIYGHPDHIAIGELAAAALVAAADPGFAAPGAPHGVAKLYYMVEPAAMLQRYQDAVGPLVMHVNGEARAAQGWPDWAITTRIATGDEPVAATVRAIGCHASQLPGVRGLLALAPDAQRAIWGVRNYCRVYSLVNPGPRPEVDLFAGLR